jgi:hypothetical protein
VDEDDWFYFFNEDWRTDKEEATFGFRF